MAFVTTLIGLGIVALALVDLLWTTIAAGSGGGPLTRRLAAVLWRGALAFHARRPGHRLLASAGPVIVFTLFLSWVATVLAGWCLVFVSSEGAVRESSTGATAGAVDRIYFTGYTVFTLGIGDYRPGDGVWQLLTVAATGTGLVLVTVGITYLVGVASAVTERRQLASAIAVLGDDAEAMLRRAWNGRDFGALRDHLIALTALIDATRQRHLTYPVLHYFHSDDQRSATPVQLVELVRALDALRHGVAEAHRPDAAVLGPLERAIDVFLTTLRTAYISPKGHPVPPLELAVLRAAGIPTTAPEDYDYALAQLRPRRRVLAGLLADDGWPAPPPRAAAGGVSGTDAGERADR